MDKLVRLIGVKNKAEAGMMAEALGEHGIDVVIMHELSGDIPGLLAGRRRRLMVYEGQAELAMQALATLQANN